MIERSPRAPVLRTRPGLAGDRLAGHGREGVVGELEADVLHLEQAGVLLDQGVLRLGEDLDQGFLVEVLQGRDDRQTADELGDQAEAQHVLRLDLAQDFAGPALVRIGHLGAEADRGARSAAGNDLLQSSEGAADDEQDVGRVDLQELLLRMLAPALRRHGGDRALHDLQQRLLNALARHVAGDRGIVRLAADLVDFVDVDDAALGPLDVVVRRLQQLEHCSSLSTMFSTSSPT